MRRFNRGLLLLLAAGSAASAQEVPPPPPPPPPAVYGPADARMIAEEVTRGRVEASVAPAILAPATIVGEETLWIGVNRRADNGVNRIAAEPSRPMTGRARGAPSARVVQKDRGLILDDEPHQRSDE